MFDPSFLEIHMMLNPTQEQVQKLYSTNLIVHIIGRAFVSDSQLDLP